MRLTPRAEHWMPLLLVAVIVCAYAPTFGAGFLNYDDPWLIQHNPYYAPSAWHTPWAAFLDLSRDTRLALGAEYLPFRDLLGWLQSRVFGIAAAPMHAVSVGLYALAVLLLRAALRRVLGPGLTAELTVLLFALHPLHVESVAWLAGQKDVLALLFITAALAEHARGSSRARVSVPLLVFAACFTKAMSLAVIFLLCAQDYLLRRRPDYAQYVLTAVVIAASLAVHVYVGELVGMVAEPAGGSRYTALMTMGPVWLRYLGHCLFPLRLSVTYFVPDAASWSTAALAGYAFVLGSLALGLLRARQGDRLWLFAFVWFFAPLAPVSQVFAPLQNRMADRYAWLSVLAPCVLLASAYAGALERMTLTWHRRALLALGLSVLMTLTWLTFERSVLFTDGVLLFADAIAKAPDDPKAAYHFARSLAEAGRDDEAIWAYREVLRRSRGSAASERRRAANGLAQLLARRGELIEAEQVLVRALLEFPGHPTLINNLAKLRRELGSPARPRMTHAPPSIADERPKSLDGQRAWEPSE